MSHTKGGWTVEHDSDGTALVRDADGELLADNLCPQHAARIAAVPEMESTLQAIDDYYGSTGATHTDKVKAALAKAKELDE